MLKWSKIGIAIALGLIMSLALFTSGSFAQSATTNYGTGQVSTHAALVTNAPQGVQQTLQKTDLNRPLANLANTARGWRNGFLRCRRVFTWRRAWWRGSWVRRGSWVTVCRRR